MRFPIYARACALAVGLVAAAAASAEMVYFEAKGTMTIDSTMGAAGDEVTVTFGYDTSTVGECGYSTTGSGCIYRFRPADMTMRVGTRVITATYMDVLVSNDFIYGNPFDRVQITGFPIAIDGVEAHSSSFMQLSLVSGDNQGNVLRGVDLPSQYQVRRFNLERISAAVPGPTPQPSVYSELTSIRRVQSSTR